MDFQRSKDGLLRALRDYGGDAADLALEDEIGGYTQGEVLRDAQAVLPALESSVHSVIDLLRRLPLVGRTLTLRPVCDGADMNPWLQEVVGLPSTIKLMTTYDLLHTPQSVLNSRANSAAADDADDGWDAADPRRGMAIPPETINHLLLLPGSMGRCGWMHLCATYILLRNETLFHPEAWAGTMAATVCHLLTLDTGAAWVREELARVRSAFAAAYNNQTAEGMGQYLAHARGDQFRECLVTASDALPGWCRCPHLTKYVFALWLCGEEAPWTAPQLRERQLGLLVELFHRAGQGLAWRAERRIQPADWLAAELPPGEEVLWMPTPKLARDVRLASITHALSVAPLDSLLSHAGLDHAKIQAAAHFQFTLASATAMVRGLAQLSGLAADGWDLSAERLASVLAAAEVRDNLRRARDPRFALAMDFSEYFRRAAGPALGEFTREALAAGRDELAVLYPLEAAALHTGAVPTPLPPEHVATYLATHGVDLGELLGLAPTGLSTVACCVPTCPHYLRPLGRPRRGPNGAFALHPRLRDHLDAAGAVPGLHKAAHALQVLEGNDDTTRVHAAVVAALVEGGHCLNKDRAPGAEKLEGQIREVGAQKPWAPHSLERRARIVTSLRARLEGDAARYQGRLAARVAAAIARHGDEEPREWLRTYVGAVLERYRGAALHWAYTDFETGMERALEWSDGRVI